MNINGKETMSMVELAGEAGLPINMVPEEIRESNIDSAEVQNYIYESFMTMFRSFGEGEPPSKDELLRIFISEMGSIDIDNLAKDKKKFWKHYWVVLEKINVKVPSYIRRMVQALPLGK